MTHAKPPRVDWEIPSSYDIRQIIGAGSYGQVVEAYDQENHRLVAIKKTEYVFDDLVDCKRTLREIAILTRLVHSSIIKLVDIIVPDDLLKFNDIYLVLEMADSDLKKLFRQAIFLTDMHVRTLLYNLLVGVKFLHSAGVYHRDLKPANCLVHQDCSIKICDFGLSRAVGMEKEIEKNIFTEKLAKKENSLVGDDDNEGSKSRKHRGLRRQLTGHIVTRWYRSPEVIFVQDVYDEGVDVWSVGCIFAELLGMLKEVVSFPSDRGPLFPGSTCFPLSPDRKHVSDYKFHARGNKDQLNMIFNVIGTPSDEDVASFEEKDIREYLRCFTKRSGMGIPEVFKAAASDASNLLERMLVFNHKRRITVEECLRHKYLAGVRGVEIVAKDQVFLPFELEPSLDEKDLRQHFISEIQKFHPEVEIPVELAAK